VRSSLPSKGATQRNAIYDELLDPVFRNRRWIQKIDEYLAIVEIVMLHPTSYTGGVT
jgi:hypothetical protein